MPRPAGLRVPPARFERHARGTRETLVTPGVCVKVSRVRAHDAAGNDDVTT
jgi:hypothetical protein